MKLYLIRHGIAAERGTYENDDERPLIALGRQKTRKVALRLYQLGVRCDRIFSSPLVRACQTAQILQEAGLAPKIEEYPPLAPDGHLQDWLEWAGENRYSSLALVGHQPDLGNWAERLVWGESQEKLILKKAGIIGLNLPQGEVQPGCGELFLLASPKWLI
jgi:phosphohistidine phosphatase